MELEEFTHIFLKFPALDPTKPMEVHGRKLFVFGDGRKLDFIKTYDYKDAKWYDQKFERLPTRQMYHKVNVIE